MENKNYRSIVIDDTAYETVITSKYLNRKKFKPVNPDELRAFIPGTVVKLFISEGQKVAKDAVLLILEAMKMHNKVRCANDCRIKRIYIKEGDMVAKGQLLIEFEH